MEDACKRAYGGFGVVVAAAVVVVVVGSSCHYHVVLGGKTMTMVACHVFACNASGSGLASESMLLVGS